MLARRKTGDERRERGTGVSDDADRRGHVLPDLRRIDVDVDDLRP